MTVRNLDAVFHPRAIALIGASRKPSSVGDVIARNLLSGGFRGPVMFVHPEAPSIRSHAAFARVGDLPHVPELAIIATPPASVPYLIRELGARGTKAVIVISAGFGEIGPAGKVLEQEILDAARPHVLRVVGPNCVGVLCPLSGINASFAHLMPASGPIALLTQSGAMLTAVLDWGHARGIGFSHLVSLGGMADVDVGDMLDYLAAEPRAKAVLAYLEHVTHARKFLSAARRVARIKPVIAIKAGRHEAGAIAAASHTGAMAGADAVYDAAFRRAGILRVQTIEALFDAAATLAHVTHLNGDRVGILTNGGGLGVMCVDKLIDEGGVLASLSEVTKVALNAVLPATWSHGNPVDIIGDAPGARYAAACEILLKDPGVDALIVLNCPVATADSMDAANATANSLDRHAQGGRPGPRLFASWMGAANADQARARFAQSGIPHYDTPEDAVEALGHVLKFQRNQALLMQIPEERAHARHDAKAAGEAIASAIKQRQEWLTEVEAKEVLNAYGIPVVRTSAARNATDAVSIAKSLGFPVALKILSPEITHKTDVGGVALNLRDGGAVERAANDMLARVSKATPNASIAGFTVQSMAQRPGAHELICGISTDPVFGPVLLFGQGGTAVEITNDKAVSLPPINEHLARDMIGRTRIFHLLAGYRGRPGANLDAIIETLLTLQDMAANHPEIVELDINPLWADHNGVLALDARIRIAECGAKGTERFAIKPYPSNLGGAVKDRHGISYAYRPIKPEDALLMQKLAVAMSADDIRMRFFTALRELPDALMKRLTQIDYDREMAFVAFGHDDGTPAGIVRLACDPDFDRAEYAVTVRSDLKGRGLGRALMNAITNYARTRGVRTIFGDVLAENAVMLGLCRKLGFSVTAKPGEPGIVEVALTLDGAAVERKADCT
jgi:acetyltransferase